MLGWLVHLYTASGVLWAMFMLEAVYGGDYRQAYLWMIVAVFVDSTDGPLARAVNVKRRVPEVDGALLDNIVDYLTWTFVPVLLLWRSGWLPEPAWPWCVAALLGSLIAFSHRSAKSKGTGVFRGFPSYWNVFALYVDLGLRHMGPWGVAGAMVALAIMSVLPIYFIYPNRATRFRRILMVGGWIWAGLVCALVGLYPDVPGWLLWLSLVYPAIYTACSIQVTLERRRAEGG